MASLTDIDLIPSQNSAWAFLNVHKRALTPLHREILIKEMVSNLLFASTIVNILPKHLSARAEHRAVIGFSLAVTSQYITRANLDSVSLAFLLPAIMKPLAESRSADVAVSLVIIFHKLLTEIFHPECFPRPFRSTLAPRFLLRGSADCHLKRNSHKDCPRGAERHDHECGTLTQEPAADQIPT